MTVSAAADRTLYPPQPSSQLVRVHQVVKLVEVVPVDFYVRVLQVSRVVGQQTGIIEVGDEVLPSLPRGHVRAGQLFALRQPLSAPRGC